MTIKEALNWIGDGHTLMSVSGAKQVCKVLGVPWADRLISSYANQKEANPDNEPKGLWLHEDKPTTGVYTLRLSDYVVDALKVDSKAGNFIGRGSQARANMEAVRDHLGVKVQGCTGGVIIAPPDMPQSIRKEDTMDKQTFMDLTGENPEDMFGGDWQNEVNDIMEAGKSEYIIMGSYQGKTEEIDNFETLKEAEKMLAEYRLAYGSDWSLWILTQGFTMLARKLTGIDKPLGLSQEVIKIKYISLDQVHKIICMLCNKAYNNQYHIHIVRGQYIRTYGQTIK